MLSSVFDWGAKKTFWYHGKNGTGLVKNQIRERADNNHLYFSCLEQR